GLENVLEFLPDGLVAPGVLRLGAGVDGHHEGLAYHDCGDVTVNPASASVEPVSKARSNASSSPCTTGHRRSSEAPVAHSMRDAGTGRPAAAACTPSMKRVWACASAVSQMETEGLRSRARTRSNMRWRAWSMSGI